MTRLYSNENFPLPVVEELRRLGHDVMTSQEAGQAGRAVSDETVLAFPTMKAARCSLSTVSTSFVCIDRRQLTQASLHVPTIRTSVIWHSVSIQRLRGKTS